jgi:hypothetical protein
MSGPDSHIDVRTEVGIALFWRDLIGNAEYAKFDPDDLMRWYFAIELRGPLEIRELLTERCMGRPVGGVTGIVSRAPHPPLWLLLLWLERYEQKIHTALPWGLAGSFVVLSFIFFSSLQGCANLTSTNLLARNPPPGTPVVAVYTPPAASYSQPPSISGQTAWTPRMASPGSTATQTGPQSNGVAGAAAGSTSPTGSTGPTSNGIAGASNQP